MRLRKISNPDEIVEMVYTDLGDVRAIINKNGNRCEGYTSKFEFNGKILFNMIERCENPHKKRFASDKKFLAAHDIDLDSYEELNDIQR